LGKFCCRFPTQFREFSGFSGEIPRLHPAAPVFLAGSRLKIKNKSQENSWLRIQKKYFGSSGIDIAR
jgi:hypothetical protein